MFWNVLECSGMFWKVLEDSRDDVITGVICIEVWEKSCNADISVTTESHEMS